MADRKAIFGQNPRAVDIRFNRRFYEARRVAAMRTDVGMAFDGYNPDSDTIYKINLDTFLDASGNPATPPSRNAEIWADNVNWRVIDTIREDNEINLHCRKRLDTA